MTTKYSSRNFLNWLNQFKKKFNRFKKYQKTINYRFKANDN